MEELEQIINAQQSMISRAGKTLRTLMFPLLISAIPLTGCDTTADNSKLEQIQQKQYPLWSHNQLEINKYQGSSVTYSHEFNKDLEFYDGSSPLQYSSIETPGRGYTYGSPRFLRHTFEDFSNFFIYEGSILTGIVAVDNDNKLVAEAKINYFLDDSQGVNKQGISMEEFHYNDEGKLIFNCESTLSDDYGAKKEEIKTLGNKERDYFFLVPVGYIN